MGLCDRFASYMEKRQFLLQIECWSAGVLLGYVINDHAVMWHQGLQPNQAQEETAGGSEE